MVISLEHESGEARAFYTSLQGPVRVGMEATGHTRWFERMLAEVTREDYGARGWRTNRNGSWKG